MISNEMMGQIYSCEGPGNAVPYGPGYDNWDYKVSQFSFGQSRPEGLHVYKIGVHHEGWATRTKLCAWR